MRRVLSIVAQLMDVSVLSVRRFSLLEIGFKARPTVVAMATPKRKRFRADASLLCFFCTLDTFQCGLRVVSGPTGDVPRTRVIGHSVFSSLEQSMRGGSAVTVLF